MRNPLPSVIRICSVAGFLLELSAFAAASGPLGWASWRRAGLGWIFWMELSSWGVLLALISLAICIVMCIHNAHPEDSEKARIGRSAWLNLCTLTLAPFVPAIAAP